MKNSFEGSGKKDELVLSMSEDLRVSGGNRFPWSCSLYLDIQPPPVASDRIAPSQLEWGASFLTPFSGLGRMVLSGAYDRLESHSFPSFSQWEGGPCLTFEKDKSFNGRWGGALFLKDKTLILHFLTTRDYSQQGIFINGGDSYMGWEGGILYTSLKEVIHSDTSWYDPRYSLEPEDLVHAQGTAKIGFYWLDSSWLFRCEGALLLPRSRKRAGRVMLSLKWEGQKHSFLVLGGSHSGLWVSCAGDETAWQQGAGIRISFFEKKAIRAGVDLIIFIPVPKNDFSHKSNITLKHDLWELYGRNDYDSLDHLSCWGGGGALIWMGNGGILKGKGDWLFEKVWEQTLTCEGELRGDIFTFGSKTTWYQKNFLGQSGEKISHKWEETLSFSITFSSPWQGEASLGITAGGEPRELKEWVLSGGIRGKY